MPFVRRMMPSFEESTHHKIICDALEEVESGDCQRLIISLPPRHSKSLLTTELFPCWCLGRNPHWEIIQSGYADSETIKHSRNARHFFYSDAMKGLFQDVVPDQKRNSGDDVPKLAHEWGTSEGGQYYAVSVRGGLTGRGGDLAIIDDPVKNWEEAHSPTVLERIWEWYTSVLLTRFNTPNYRIVITMTRWVEDDLVGRVLKQAKADDPFARKGGWRHIRMPAINDGGEALWPSRWPLDALLALRSDIPTRQWSALFQQNPVPPTGTMFNPDNIVEIPLESFPDVRYCRGWDLASTEKERAKRDPDYTAGALVGSMLEDGEHTTALFPSIFLKDLVRIQEEAPKRDRIILATADRDGDTVEVAGESVAGYKDTVTRLRALLVGSRVVHKVAASRDKVVRASILEPIIEARRFYVPTGAPWVPDLKAELLAFPHGDHDDIVDAIGVAFAKAKPELLDFLGLDRGRMGF